MSADPQPVLDNRPRCRSDCEHIRGHTMHKECVSSVCCDDEWCIPNVTSCEGDTSQGHSIARGHHGTVADACRHYHSRLQQRHDIKADIHRMLRLAPHITGSQIASARQPGCRFAPRRSGAVETEGHSPFFIPAPPPPPPPTVTERGVDDGHRVSNMRAGRVGLRRALKGVRPATEATIEATINNSSRTLVVGSSTRRSSAHTAGDDQDHIRNYRMLDWPLDAPPVHPRLTSSWHSVSGEDLLSREGLNQSWNETDNTPSEGYASPSWGDGNALPTSPSRSAVRPIDRRLPLIRRRSTSPTKLHVLRGGRSQHERAPPHATLLHSNPLSVSCHSAASKLDISMSARTPSALLKSSLLPRREERLSASSVHDRLMSESCELSLSAIGGGGRQASTQHPFSTNRPFSSRSPIAVLPSCPRSHVRSVLIPTRTYYHGIYRCPTAGEAIERVLLRERDD